MRSLRTNSHLKTCACCQVFGQDHVAKVLFDWSMEGASHDAVVDAIKSIRLFNYYHSLQANPPEWEEAKVTTARLNAVLM